MPKPRVAVLLAAHQPGPELEEQLSTILSQDGVDVRVYVGHDGPEAGSESNDLRRRLAIPGVRLVYSRPIGSASQNFFELVRSVDLSRYDLIALSDQDDLWFPGKLLRAHDVLSTQADCGGYSANVAAFRGNQPDVARRVLKSQAQRPYDHFFESAGPGCTYVLKPDMALALQAWLLEMSDQALQRVDRHDWLIYAWARVRHYGWSIDHQVVLYYRQHDRNVVGVHHGWIASWIRLKQVRQGWYRSQVRAIACLVGAQDDFQAKFDRAGMVQRLQFAWRGRRRFRDRIALCIFVALGWV